MRSFEGDFINYITDINRHGYDYPTLIGDAEIKNETFDVQTIMPKKFRVDGVDHYLCWTNEIAEAIGIPMRCFDDMNDEIICLNNCLIASNNQIEQFKSASLWQRFKWLFTGVQ